MGRVLIAVAVVEVGVAEAIQKVVDGARDIRDGMMGVDVTILAMTHAVTLPGIVRQLCRRSVVIQTRSSTRMSVI